MTQTHYENRLHAWPKVGPDDSPWKSRHVAAIRCSEGFERVIVNMISNWLMYADLHSDRYESGIGDDGVLGPCWAKIGQEIRGLLNGESGRLDCGTLDSILYNTLKDEGFDPDTM